MKSSCGPWVLRKSVEHAVPLASLCDGAEPYPRGKRGGGGLTPFFFFLGEKERKEGLEKVWEKKKTSHGAGWGGFSGLLAWGRDAGATRLECG